MNGSACLSGVQNHNIVMVMFLALLLVLFIHICCVLSCGKSGQTCLYVIVLSWDPYNYMYNCMLQNRVQSLGKRPIFTILLSTKLALRNMRIPKIKNKNAVFIVFWMNGCQEKQDIENAKQSHKKCRNLTSSAILCFNYVQVWEICIRFKVV